MIASAPFGRETIEQILPHRPPFLLLDEVVELEPGARKRIVRPGDELTLECTLETVRGPIGRGKARATVGGQLAVRGTLTFAVGEADQ